jgi:hypothetical protein
MTTDAQWLRELFEYENCAECGQDETGHIVRPDPLGLPHAWCRHYHVQRHADDSNDDIYRTWGIGDAMRYAAAELTRRISQERSMIRAYGAADDFENAYRTWQRSEAWATIANHAKDVHKQYSTECGYRAPLYRNNVAVLHKHAGCIVDMINQKGPNGFYFWACTNAECAPNDPATGESDNR